MRRRTPAGESPASSATEATGANVRRRGRQPAQAAPEAGSATAPRTRTPRRRRSQAGGETSRLIEALLKSRGAKGATQTEVAQVVAWAQNVLAEGVALKADEADLRKLGPRGKRSSPVAAARQKQQKEQRQQEIAGRTQRHAMDRALLDGVLAGSISVDVKDGELVFLGGQFAAEHAGATTTEPVV